MEKIETNFEENKKKEFVPSYLDIKEALDEYDSSKIYLNIFNEFKKLGDFGKFQIYEENTKTKKSEKKEISLNEDVMMDFLICGSYKGIQLRDMFECVMGMNTKRVSDDGTSREAIFDLGKGKEMDEEKINNIKILYAQYLKEINKTDKEIFLSIEDENNQKEGEFNPQKFLRDEIIGSKINSEERREKMKLFSDKLANQLGGLDNVISAIDENISIINPWEMIDLIQKNDDFKKLSKQQKFLLKEKIFDICLIRQNIKEDTMYINKNGVKKFLVDNFPEGNFKENDLGGQIDFFRSNNSLIFIVHDNITYLKLDERKKDIKEDVDGGAGFKTKDKREMPILFVKKEYFKYEEIEDSSKFSQGENIEELMRDKKNEVFIHEERHVRDDILLGNLEKNDKAIIDQTKILVIKEVAAYLKQGIDIFSLESNLSKIDDLYSYGLKGKEWKEHIRFIERRLGMLSEVGEGGKINLDILTLMPKKWRLAMNINEFTTTEEFNKENIVEIKGVDNLKRGHLFKKDARNEITKDSNLGDLLAIYDRHYNDSKDDDEKGYFIPLLKNIISESGEILVDYERKIIERNNLLEGDDSRLNIEYYLIHECVGAGKDNEEDRIKERKRIKNIFRNRLFEPLLKNEDEEIKRIGEQIINKGKDPIFIEYGGEKIKIEWFIDEIRFAKEIMGID